MEHVADAASIGAVALSIVHAESSLIVVGNTTVMRELVAIEFWGLIVILYLVYFWISLVSASIARDVTLASWNCDAANTIPTRLSAMMYSMFEPLGLLYTVRPKEVVACTKGLFLILFRKRVN